MADKKKRLHDFLSGKESEEGKKIFDTWYHSIPENDSTELHASEETLKDELKKIKHKNIVPPKPAQRYLFPYWKAAAVALLVISAGILFYTQRNSVKQQEMITFTEHAVPRGKILHLSLSDGSQVWLNADTKFRCPEKFGAGDREVYLEGEAFFEVSKDPARPFKIHSGRLMTTVLGTSFNIKSYGTDDINEVAVITGKVSVVQTGVNKHSSEIMLQPGQKAVLMKSTGDLSKKIFTDMSHYTSWKNGKLIFENTPIANVIPSLERYYNIEIHLDSEALKSCRVTATFDPMPLEKAMYLLSYTLNAKYTRTGNVYSIKGGRCKSN
jgi:ferric-dicitrate binding protein FerR (iron transport regulator)